MNPLVSVVMTAYNAADTIAEAIESVLRQEGVDLELIIVDDGSTDGTADVIRTITDPRVRLDQPGRLGRPAAMNRAVEIARGPLIAINDADDTSFPERLHKHAGFLTEHPEIDVVGGQVLAYWGDKEWRLRYPLTHDPIVEELERRRMPIAHCTVMMRRGWFVANGGLDTTLARVEDFELYFRCRRSTGFAALSDDLVRYRFRPLTYQQWLRDRQFYLKSVGLNGSSFAAPLGYAKYRAVLWTQRQGLGLTSRQSKISTD